MPRLARYVVKTETVVRLYELPATGGEVEVAAFTVRAEGKPSTSDKPDVVRSMVEQAMARVARGAKIMAAALDNTERNRLK